MTHASQTTTWLEKVFIVLVSATILVLAFFFLAVALVAGAVLALIVAARWWWLTRKLRKSTDGEIIEGQYTIVEHAGLESHERTKKE
jgi:membrane protein implicated in regulation of membrane protease activity